MYCPKCGTRLEGKPKFCHRCGQRVMQVYPQPRPVRFEPHSRPERRPTVWPRRLRTYGVLLLLSLLMCSVASAAIYFWLGFNNANQTVSVVPPDAVAFISLSPNILQIPQLIQTNSLAGSAAIFAPLATLPGVTELRDKVAKYLPLDLDVDLVKEVLPWIGPEISLATLSFSGNEPTSVVRSTTNVGQDYTGPPLVLAAATRNEGRSNTFMTSVRVQMERAGVVFENSTHRDILLTEIISPTQVPLAYAVFNDLIVLATDIETLRRAVDTALNESGADLTTGPEFQEIFDELPANRLGYLYLDRSALSNGMAEELQIWQLGEIKQAGIAVSLGYKKIRLDFVLQYDPSSLTASQQDWLRLPADANTLAEQAPADTLFFLSGQSFFRAWEAIDDPVAREIVTDLREETGIDLIEDLLVPLSGENAAAILRDRGGFLGHEEIPVGLLFLADAEDRQRAEQTLDSLFAIAGREVGYAFIEDEISREPVRLLETSTEYIARDYFSTANVTVANWLREAEGAEVALGYGLSGANLVVGSSTEVLRSAFGADRSPLAENDSFRAAVQLLPEERLGYLYVDVQQSLRAWESSLTDMERERFIRDIRPYLESIRSVSMAVGSTDRTGMLHGVLYVLTE